MQDDRTKPTLIPGIGELRTSWIGAYGVQELSKQYEQTCIEEDNKQLKNKLKQTCRNMHQSIQFSTEVTTAMELCNKYTKRRKKRLYSVIDPTSSAARLWSLSDEDQIDEQDPHTLSNSILEEHLTNTLTENHRQPPDVSTYFCDVLIFSPFIRVQIYIGTSRRTVIQNTDMTKALKIGMLVAMQNNGDKLPLVGRVTSISMEQQQVNVQMMKQERASHKPKWLRRFNNTDKSRVFSFGDILLYDFMLTSKGCFKKKSREYLQKL